MPSEKLKAMLTSILRIVALPYYEAGGCLGEFLAEAQGRSMTLRPEPTNDFDANAIRAYDWQGRHVVMWHRMIFKRHGRRCVAVVVIRSEDVSAR